MKNNEKEKMTYVIITKTDWGMELRHDIPGTKSLEKFTDSRIMNIYKDAIAIMKLYAGSLVTFLKDYN